MKKLMMVWAVLIAFSAAGRAQVGDAFKGILPVTDRSMTKSLNGQWQLKVVKGIAADRQVPAADASWKAIPVPGCWEQYGFCEPKYTYPDSLTGYYRTAFTVPAAWKGQQVVLRMDGVLRGYDVWLNGRLVGTWESAYNTCLFDLTPYLKSAGEQQLALRVYSRFKGYEFDCFDDWAAMGIFRDVTLFAVPKTHMAGFKVSTVSAEGRRARVRFEATVAHPAKQTRIRLVVRCPDGLPAEGGSLTLIPDAVTGVAVHEMETADASLWTAETPVLYTVDYTLCQGKKDTQHFTQRFGIRQLTVDGNILKLNGRPVKLRGVNYHATDPRTVKVVDEALLLRDMRLMKEASVNYIRTSHYPQHPRFYELADSLGFYVINEVPFGMGTKHLSNKSYQDILLTRAHATVERDKNYASVLIWSVGNENPFTPICEETGNEVKRIDPTRPICYPQVGSYFRGKDYQWPAMMDIYAPHYPRTGEFAGFYAKADRPVIFTEYCHSLGQSFEDHDRQWEIIERTPCQAGGSVWEWADQGMPFREPLADRYGYQEKVYTSADSGFMMAGNQGTDGLLYANRVPLPNYYELQYNYARAALTDSILQPVQSGDAVELTVRNRYDFINLKDHVTFNWALTADCDTICRGAFSPDCAPRATARYRLALPLETLAGRLALLHVTATDAQGHITLRQSMRFAVGAESAADRLRAALPQGDNPMELIRQWTVRAGRKATMAERIKVKDDRLARYLLPVQDAEGKRQLPATGSYVATGERNFHVGVDLQNEQQEGGRAISFTLTPDSASIFLSELGLAMLLDPSIDRVQWIGYGPFAAYPGRRNANRYGIWAKQKDDLYLEGNRIGVEAALLTDKEGNGLLVVCDSANVNFEQTDLGLVLTYNCAVSGSGPKFAPTAFPVWASGVGSVKGRFALYRVSAGQRLPLFMEPAGIPAPFKPFETQYDTYLMRYKDIVAE